MAEWLADGEGDADDEVLEEREQEEPAVLVAARVLVRVLRVEVRVQLLNSLVKAPPLNKEEHECLEGKLDNN